MGTASPGVAELEFDDCRLPADSLLGEEGKAFSYAMECLNEGRLTVGANAVGMGAKALEEAISFARQRQAFGKPISGRSEEHTSELQSLMRTSYAVFCLKKKNNTSSI